MKILLLSTFLFIGLTGITQTTKKVCFLGNSYTYYNDLPTMISTMATADGNILVKDQNTPGGYTLEGHSTNATSLSKISSDTWDYVVLQDQSQMPSFPWSQVQTDVFPYAEILVDSIRAANECAVPLFFNTWGRRDGDPQWDSINTFEKMNLRLFNAYGYMADLHSGKRAPVGIGFEHVYDDATPPVTHTQLYSGDGSHPSIHGSYLAACVFYEMIFEQTCVGNTYLPSGVTQVQADYLQGVANHVVNDVDSVDVDFTQPFADFTYTLNGTEVTFINNSLHDFEWNWDFGDLNSSADENPVHTYATVGSYDVTLTATYCGNSDDTTITVAWPLGNNENAPFQFKVVPNPTNGNFNIVYNGPETIYEIWSMDGILLNRGVLGEPLGPIIRTGTYLIKVGDKTELLIVQ